jgi:putative ABC transport system permease protein
VAYSDGTTAERLNGRLVSWTYFGLLGISPAIGRDFEGADGRPGSPPAVVVSHGFWQQRLGGRADALQKPVRLDGQNYTLVGILPLAVGPLERGQDVFMAAQWEPPARKGPFFITVLGRLRPDTAPSVAADELHAINRRMFPVWRASYQDDKATWNAMDLKTHIVGDVGTVAGLALAAVGLVWLIACANASSLLVARVTSRRHELAVRAALGASRRRVVRHLLAESGLLALGAAALGLALAWSGIEVLRDFDAGFFPRTQEIALSGAVLGLLAALTAASVFLFGFIPALHGSGGRVEDSLRSSGRSSTGGTGVRRLQRALVASQFAITTPLLIIAGLLVISLNELGRVDLGFDSRNVLSGTLTLPPAAYPEPARVTAFWDELQRRIGSLPGVSGVTFADGRPPTEVNNVNNFDLEDRPTPAGRSQPVTPWISVAPEYFRVLGVNLRQGRLLDSRDTLAANTEAIVVDRAWANRFFPKGAALGRRLREGGCTRCPWVAVVGIVDDIKYVGLDKPDEGTVYAPLQPQRRSRFLLLRTSTNPAGVLTAVRKVLRQLDPNLPFSNVATIDELTAGSLQKPRSLAALVGGFAFIAVILSIVGIYGVMAYYVQQHAKEITIRLALGGRPARVMTMIVGQGMKAVSSGVIVGVVAAFGVTPLISSLMFGVRAHDARTVVAIGLFLLAVAVVACIVPARRTMGMEPAMVLRED